MEGVRRALPGYRTARGIAPENSKNYLSEFRKLFRRSHRLYMQDHSRGRGLTTTGQPTVSLLPLKSPQALEFTSFI
jgi:hypothetical protein